MTEAEELREVISCLQQEIIELKDKLEDAFILIEKLKNELKISQVKNTY